MAYALDRLYNEVIRNRMADLATRVKVREIVPHLACLTISDREEIEAKREIAGNYCAMILLLDNLRRRENWPDQFVLALRECEQETLANDISEAYDRIRGIRTQRTAAASASAPVPHAAATAGSVHTAAPPAAVPSPAPSPAEVSATVTTATIHSVPHPIPTLLIPSVEASDQSPTPSPMGPYSKIAAPGSNEAPALVSAPDAPVHPPPESAHLVVLSPDEGPPIPVSAPMLTPPIGQNAVLTGSGDTSKLGIAVASVSVNFPTESCSNVASPDLTEAPIPASALEVLAPHAMPLSPVSTTRLSHTVGQSEVPVGKTTTGGLTTIALSQPSSVAAPIIPASTSSQINKPTTTSSVSPKKGKDPFAVLESSGSIKHPIQVTDPGTVLVQDSTGNQVVDRVHTAVSPNYQTQDTSQGTAQASPSAFTNAVPGRLSNFAAENEENFSKPCILRAEENFSVSSDPLQISHTTKEHSPVQPARHQAVSNPRRAEEPVAETVSVCTDDLMISSSITTVPSQCASDPIVPVQSSTPRALENGFPEGDNNSYPNQPVEDHYESSCESMRTRVHIVEVSERPSVQNLNAQPPSMDRPPTISLKHSVKAVSEDQPSQHRQGISQCIQGNNDSEQASPAPDLTIYAEPASATLRDLELNASGQINIPRSEQREESQGVLRRLRSNSYLIAAAAIGMTAVFVAWRLKN